MPVCALYIEAHLPQSGSLKDKRMVVRHLLDVARRRYRVAAAEVAHQDLRQRATMTFAAVSSSSAHLEEILDEVERLIWSTPDLEVLTSSRHWLEEDD